MTLLNEDIYNIASENSIRKLQRIKDIVIAKSAEDQSDKKMVRICVVDNRYVVKLIQDSG